MQALLSEINQGCLLKTENEAVFLGYMARQVEKISELYRRLPQLELKAGTVKAYLGKKNSSDP